MPSDSKMPGDGFFRKSAGLYTSTGMGEFILVTSFIVPDTTTTSLRALTSGLRRNVYRRWALLSLKVSVLYPTDDRTAWVLLWMRGNVNAPCSSAVAPCMPGSRITDA